MQIKKVSSHKVILVLIIVLGAFLRFYKIQQNLIFNGETGYDYMTIRTFVENHQIPLIGPRTSHEWFFIGSLFYWIFGILMPVFNYNVLVGAYFFGVVGVLSILVCYFVLKPLFGQKAALICSFLVSISPLWVQLTHDARFNGATGLLFFPFYYFLVRSTEDKGLSLFKLGLTLGVMFSFFPSPILLLPGAVVVLFLYRKKIAKKYFLPGILGFIIPNIPYLVYNAQHKFEIIKSLFVWIPYRIAGFLGLYPKNTVTSDVLRTNITGLYTFFQQSYLQTNNILIFVLIICVIVFAIKNIQNNQPLKILLVVSVVSYLGLFLHGAPPQHYYLVIFPVPLILISLFLENIGMKNFWVAVAILSYLLIINFRFYFSDKWFYMNSARMSDDMTFVPYSLQLKVTDLIAKDAGEQKFSLARVGPLDYFGENFSLNYQYLLWNLGKKPDQKAKLKYTIYEDTRKLLENEKIVWVENIAVTKNEKP